MTGKLKVRDNKLLINSHGKLVYNCTQGINGSLCNFCTVGGLYTLTFVVDGIANGACSDCVNMNGTWANTFMAPTCLAGAEAVSVCPRVPSVGIPFPWEYTPLLSLGISPAGLGTIAAHISRIGSIPEQWHAKYEFTNRINCSSFGPVSLTPFDVGLPMGPVCVMGGASVTAQIN